MTASGQLYYEDVSVGDEVPPLQKRADTRQLVKYAGASGDFYEIHYDAEFAARAGHESVLIHGALKSAWLAQMLTDWIGDRGRLVEFSISYRRMDYPYDTLTCRGTVTDKRIEDGVGLVECEIGLENGQGTVTTPGTAVVSLPIRGA
ncbi:MAG: MaoC/PaaZ C-terminal domain-containing protein [Chloroflexota bacterium]